VPRLSIIIPVVGELTRLEDTLVSVLQHRPDDCQVIVVLNRPYDDPYGLSGDVCFVETSAESDLVGVINAGICAARAPLVHLLMCGVKVEPDWIESALRCFDDPAVAAVAPLIVQKDEPGRVMAAGVQYRHSGVVRGLARGRRPDEVHEPTAGFCGPDLLAAFYRKSALSTAGLFDHALGGQFSGADMAMTLRCLGLQSVLQPECRVYADPAALCVEDAFLYGFRSEQLFWFWARRLGWLRSLVAHAVLLAGEVLRCPIRPSLAARLSGRLLGVALMPLHRRSRPRLAAQPSRPGNTDSPAAAPAMLRPRRLESVGT